MSPVNGKSSRFARNTHDYRFGFARTSGQAHPLDCSLMTYRGHEISKTLIRCYFSSKEMTEQKYIISGSANSGVYVYDVLTGKLVRRLSGHTSLVRDVSWHPCELKLVSTSWDGTLGLWDFADDRKKDFYPRNVHIFNGNRWW